MFFVGFLLALAGIEKHSCFLILAGFVMMFL